LFAALFRWRPSPAATLQPAETPDDDLAGGIMALTVLDAAPFADDNFLAAVAAATAEGGGGHVSGDARALCNTGGVECGAKDGKAVAGAFQAGSEARRLRLMAAVGAAAVTATPPAPPPVAPPPVPPPPQPVTFCELPSPRHVIASATGASAEIGAAASASWPMEAIKVGAGARGSASPSPSDGDGSGSGSGSGSVEQGLPMSHSSSPSSPTSSRPRNVTPKHTGAASVFLHHLYRQAAGGGGVKCELPAAVTSSPTTPTPLDAIAAEVSVPSHSARGVSRARRVAEAARENFKAAATASATRSSVGGAGGSADRESPEEADADDTSRVPGRSRGVRKQQRRLTLNRASAAGCRVYREVYVRELEAAVAKAEAERDSLVERINQSAERGAGQPSAHTDRRMGATVLPPSAHAVLPHGGQAYGAPPLYGHFLPTPAMGDAAGRTYAAARHPAFTAAHHAPATAAGTHGWRQAQAPPPPSAAPAAPTAPWTRSQAPIFVGQSTGGGAPRASARPPFASARGAPPLCQQAAGVGAGQVLPRSALVAAGGAAPLPGSFDLLDDLLNAGSF